MDDVKSFLEEQSLEVFAKFKPLPSHLWFILVVPIDLIILKLICRFDLPEAGTSTHFGSIRILFGHKLVGPIKLVEFVIQILDDSGIDCSIHVEMD